MQILGSYNNDAALNKFMADHGILDDIQIEWSGPNEDANLVKGNKDRIPVRIWMIHQVGLRFFISLILEEVMARYRLTFIALNPLHVYIVMRSKKKPGTHLLKGLRSFAGSIELWRPKFSIVELGKHVIVANFAKDHDTSFAHAYVVMLPKNIADLAEEASEEIRALLMMQQVQYSNELKKSKKKVSNFKSKVKKTKLELAASEQLKLDLVVVEEAQDSSYVAITQAQNEAAFTKVQRDNALHDFAELQKVACDMTYEQVFNWGISRAGISTDHSAWAKAAPKIELSDSPEPYSPLVLPGFNKEEYMDQPTERVVRRTLWAKAISSGGSLGSNS
ncbi:hypothetical protein Acr_06g0010850 [Actinidia rufa]|uniref:Uncharacterized protein n=1 Tax=Actinidia rufa TaxID=165716 RepID=A0A7J0ERN8_9ERIC|nr:hypothetical protein Acr_06g0010850 [Actinidia rufa]